MCTYQRVTVFGNSLYLPKMIASHVVDVFVNHVQANSFRMAVALDGPGLLVPVVALRQDRGGQHHGRRWMVGTWRWSWGLQPHARGDSHLA